MSLRASITLGSLHPCAAAAREGDSACRQMPADERTLRLTTPFMSGPDVAETQRALGVEDDGVYGPETARAVTEWKRRRGDATAAPELTPADRRRLLREVPRQAVALMERWAAAGLREEPPGSDRVPRLVRLAGELGVADSYRGMSFPWCAFAAFLAALKAGGRAADLGLRRSAFNPLYTPSVLAEAQAGRSGLRLVAPDRAERGDLVLFDWSPGGDPADHVARLRRPPSGGRVETVDGNSGDEGLVALRERPLASVRAFARDR